MRKVLTIAEVLEFAKNDRPRFYKTKMWQKLRLKVLAKDNFECVRCKAKGIYTKADTVHHVQYLDKFPEQGLDEYYEFKGEKHRNLISLCHACHEEIHGRTENLKKNNEKKFLNEEKW